MKKQTGRWMRNGAVMYFLSFSLFVVLGTVESADVQARTKYYNKRPRAELRLEAKDYGIVLRHGDGPNQCDVYGARDVWVFESDGTYYMHYDAAGPNGWLCSLATSTDLVHWQKKGPVLNLGNPDEDDSKSASYGTTYFDGRAWHMFYLATPNTTPPPDRVPIFPYLTMKAKSMSPGGPWIKQKEVIPFRTKPKTYYDVTASPGSIVKYNGEYLQFFSATKLQDEDNGRKSVRRTLGIARTKDLDGQWTIDSAPIVTPEEQIENSSLYYEETNKTWFLFTNHVGIKDGVEYTDAIWVYWSKDLNKWDSRNKAVVLDGQNCKWSKRIVGLPSVLRTGNKLAIFYDGLDGEGIGHMRRDIGLAWLNLPLIPPGSLTPTNLRCEYRVNPLGIDVEHPRLSWILRSNQRCQKQTAYQVLVASSRDKLDVGRADLWDSGRVSSDQSVHIVYAGRPLLSYMRCFWKVRVWDKNQKESGWSTPAMWTMGILEEKQWQGQWIGYTKLPGSKSQVDDLKVRVPAPIFRKTFILKKNVRSASVYICGLGYYELRLNGSKVGDHVLDPAFTRYDRRVLYVSYDVGRELIKGKNSLAVMLGNGWQNVHTRAAWDFDKAPWRARPKMLLQLRIEYTDGSTQLIVSNESWRASEGPVVRDAIREGEHYDARLEQTGWDMPDFDDSGWDIPQIVDAPKGKLAAQIIQPIKVMETIKPQKLTEPAPGVFVFDLGQNIAGWAQIRLSGPAGTTVKLRYGERLKSDGTLEQSQIKVHVKEKEFQTDIYILNGRGEEIWEPRFVYHGFQYVEVTGFPGRPSLDNLCGRVVHTSFESAGTFECSNNLLNAIQRNALWSYRSNFHGYPTDCPHREKNGWTGDAHLAAEMGLFNFKCAAAYTKWMDDFKDEQRQTGELPGIIPTSGWGYQWGNGPAWDSAYLLIPWYMYQYCGDRRILETHYERFKRYVNYLTGKAKNHIVSIGLGDWVPAKTHTPASVTSTGYYYVDTLIVAKIARMLGKKNDAEKYTQLAENIRNAFNKSFYKGEGIYANGSQTALSCALYQQLVEEKERNKVVEKLVANIEKNDSHIDTGILGAKYLFNALTANGKHNVAYRIATQTTPPSYGSWIKRGATTLWEDWMGVASLNHIMFGDISAWFYKNLAGINMDPENPGFKHIIFHPQPVGDLKWVRAKHESMYGTIRSSWYRDSQSFKLDLTVPANTTATVYVPAKSIDSITESGKAVDKAEGVRFLKMEGDDAVFEIGSGNYCFQSEKPKLTEK